MYWHSWHWTIFGLTRLNIAFQMVNSTLHWVVFSLIWLNTALKDPYLLAPKEVTSNQKHEKRNTMYDTCSSACLLPWCSLINSAKNSIPYAPSPICMSLYVFHKSWQLMTYFTQKLCPYLNKTRPWSRGLMCETSQRLLPSFTRLNSLPPTTKRSRRLSNVND